MTNQNAVHCLICQHCAAMVPIFVNCSEPDRSKADRSEDNHLHFELQGRSEDRSGEADVNGMGINKYKSEDRRLKTLSEEPKTEDWRVTWMGKGNSNRRLTGGHWGGGNFQCSNYIEIVQSVLISQFCVISSDFYDFTRFQPDFTHFRFCSSIQPIMHVLTTLVLSLRLSSDFESP